VRVTDKMIFDAAATNSGRARSDEELAASQASTGLRVQHPWDDPAAAGLTVKHDYNADRFAAIGQGVQRASDELNAVDGALTSLNNTLSRARQLAVQLSNDTYSAADRSAGASEVQSLRTQVISLLNTQFGNRYLFAGNKDGQPAFDDNGNYLGDSGIRQVEIAPGQLEDASVRGDVIAKGAGGGTDVLATLQTLATALAGNDVAGVRATLNGLDSGIQQVATGQAKVGGQMNLFDLAVQTSQKAQTAEKSSSSQLTDVDAIQAASNLALAQRALDASLTASAQSFNLTLLNKLQ
jgi:flagellar hook-associated protein 3 FlgL